MIPIRQIANPEVAQMASDASRFLSAHRWCGEITSGRLGFAIAGVVGLFQFDFRPTEPDVDDRLWVVVGDLPSAYLVADDNPGWQDALEGYIHEMRRWVSAAREGKALVDIIPVNAEPSDEHATMLESRLDFLERELVQVRSDRIEGDI